MTANDYRRIAWALILSLASGIAVIAYGSIDRAIPPNVDLIWAAADTIHHQLQDGSLVLAEGEAHERMADQYLLSLRRLPKDPSSPERYLLKIQSRYDLLPTTVWRPSSWDLAFTASGAGPDRRVNLVAARKLKD